MKGTLLATLLLSAAAGSALAQQQPQFTHYGLNGMYLNPAYAGIKGQGEFNLIGRYQYLNYNGTIDDGGSPRTGLFTASLPVSTFGGVGVAVYYDQVGVSKMTNAALSYSQHVKLGNGKLGIGVQGIYTYLSKGTYRAIDDLDPNVPRDGSDSKFDIGAGLWYESPKFYAGLSMNNLLRSEYTFRSEGTNNPVSAKYLNENHAYFTAGYNIEASSSVVVTPNVLVKAALPGKFSNSSKFDNSKNYSYEGGVRATFNDRFWAGLNYRYEESFAGLVGLSFAKDNAFRIGYAFDFIAFNEAARAFSSHEIMLTYRLPKVGMNTRPAIRTPRYSF
jgi:type IX secretion system PorP/SprF family membrane protein